MLHGLNINFLSLTGKNLRPVRPSVSPEESLSHRMQWFTRTMDGSHNKALFFLVGILLKCFLQQGSDITGINITTNRDKTEDKV